MNEEEYATRMVLRATNFLGYSRLILKSDQEPAIVKVLEHVRDHRGEEDTQIALEHSPAFDSRANGMAERAVQSLEGQIRTMVLALEHKLQTKIDADDCVIPWLIVYAAVLINRFHVGADNKTNLERLRGRKSKRELVEFGESVLWLPQEYKDQPKLDSKFLEGNFIGVKEDTDELIIGTQHGIFISRSMKRRPLEQRWNPAAIKAIHGTPWKPYAHTSDDALRSSLPANTSVPPALPGGVPEHVVQPDAESVPRRLRIERRDLEKMGYTPGCPGCYSAKHRRPHRPHTERCRQTILQKMKALPEYAERLEAAQNRETILIERMLQEHYGPDPAGARDAPDLVPREAAAEQPVDDEHLVHPSPDVPMGPPVSAEQGIDMEDTSFLYPDINNDLQNTMANNLETAIANISESDPDLMRKIMDTVNAHVSLSMRTTRPTSTPCREQILHLNQLSKPFARRTISEIYSRPRVTTLSEKFGFARGVALDLSVLDPEDDLPWDFTLKHNRERALKLLGDERPYLLILSPMCKAFSVINNLNKERMGPARWAAMQAAARVHLKFAMQLCQQQMDQNNYFLFEHPLTASSWQTPEVQAILSQGHVECVRADQCMLGLRSRDAQGEAPAMKPTRFMTNASYLAKTLGVRCDGKHRHVLLVDGRAHKAEIYPAALCEAILRGIRDQLWHDEKIGDDGQIFSVHAEPEPEYLDFDDISGAPLDGEHVRRARAEELQHFKDHGVYKKVPLEECRRVTGKSPIGTMWLDINTGDALNPDHRSRLVANECNTHHAEEMFAATPPLEAKKILFSMAASQGKNNTADPLKLLFVVVRRAFFYARAKRDIYIYIYIYVKLPPEDDSPGQCGKLQKAMYGTRDAPALWEE